MKKLYVLLLVLSLSSLPLCAQTMVIKVKVEGTLPDVVKLIERLNKNGKKHSVQFKLSGSEYDYRIATGTTDPTFRESFFMGEEGKEANAAVLTPDCQLLFIVSRGGRWTRGGALNALSKEIAKNLARYHRSTHQ